MRKHIFSYLPLFVLLAGCFCAFWVSRLPVSLKHDIVAYNRIAGEAARHWENLSQAEFQDRGYPFSIVSMDGKIKYRSSEYAVTDVIAAISSGCPVLDVTVDGKISGKLIISENPDGILARYRDTTAMFLFTLTVLFSAASFLYYLYIRKTILKPFRELEQFALQVAGGNLSFPLKMNRNNLFGAFTQSFDMMREQILLAREKEFKAGMNQKELVASLSHDIKTPVTSIKLTGELLMELEQDDRLKKKIGMICRKTEQIEELINNLFQTTLQDMEQLNVAPTEVYSREIRKMLLNIDYEGKVRLSPIPDCLIYLDELRFTQVLSNIISNSYKYAGTDIEADATLTDSCLKLSLRDFGPGVPEDELPFLFNRFYRGSNADGKAGSGLGLTICKKLMEQMRGDIYCTCMDGCFTVTLLIKLL